ncbi:PIN domain-containing protein [Xanthobacter autotrophicus DSM 597]|uniref:type II toxin-antitoxin system VapC family toxin n=1 Tax=Xanthobacter TaxID=279 RepID=UPI001AE94054|nr:PIN domain-containing protein [Xanthobacter flavus]MBP2151935.1 putative nucleic acid-binding protein [Xanthobacter flavus]
MILVDTSVWIDHFRQGDMRLQQVLAAGAAILHPFVIGELALGNLRRRDVILEALAALPQATVAETEEVLGLIAAEALYGRGIGYVDAHLVAAVRLTPGAVLWTRDKRLAAVAERLGIAFQT